MQVEEHGTPTWDVPARAVPVPLSVSPEARSVLAPGPVMPEDPRYPAPDDLDGWRDFMAQRRQERPAVPDAGQGGERVEEVTVGRAVVYVITPPGVSEDDPAVYLDIHGGGLIFGDGDQCRAYGTTRASQVGMRTWAVDYRMPPDHPFPAPLDDCVAAYRRLLEEVPESGVVVGGESAGGNLAAATILRARDEGLPLPAAAVLLTPEVDLTESGDTFSTNLGLDNILTHSLMPINLLYAAGHDLGHPYVSPLFGDFSRGFPPTFLKTGTRDLFLSNTVRMHRALRSAGVPAELHVQEAAGHGGFFGLAPEDHEIGRELVRFVREHVPGR